MDLDRLTAAEARAIDDGLLRNNGHQAAPKLLQGLFSVSQGDSSPPTQDLPPLFSKPFLEVIGRALGEGQLSVRRAAGLLGHPIDDLPGLFAAHEVRDSRSGFDAPCPAGRLRS